MFKNYFDGEGKVRMVVCISPKSDDYDETVHVMKFAELAQEVQVTRPQEKRVDYGLTPGRRNAQKLYREAMDQLEEMKRAAVDENTSPPVVATAPSIGQIPMTLSFPMITAPELVSCDDEVTLMAFVQSLREKQQERQHFLEDFNAKQRQLRDMLTRVDGGYRELRQALSDADEAIAAKDGEIQRMEMRIRKAEKKAHQDAISQQRQQWEQETERKLAALRREMQEKIWRKEEKLRQLREIVQQQSKKPACIQEGAGTPGHVNDLRQVPAVRARNRKRSLSADNYLAHKPRSNLPTDTVLQPQLKKKKTVSMPKLKHLKTKSGGCSKYLLTHQEQDSQGEIETHLYKGEVWKTRGGGAAIQFTDVETLKCEKPITPERKESQRHSAPPSASSESELSIDCASDSPDIEAKCGYGIEGRAGSVPGYTNAYTERKSK
jgi:kinesin family protein 23